MRKLGAGQLPMLRSRVGAKEDIKMVKNLYRNESLVQMETYESDPIRADELIAAVREKWAVLREGGHAGDYPVEILRSGPSNGNGGNGGNGHEKVKVVE